MIDACQSLSSRVYWGSWADVTVSTSCGQLLATVR